MDIGPHIGWKRLIAYREGTLPAAEREALQEHLSLCQRCTAQLLELRDFEAASARGDAAGPETLREEAWESLAQRLPWKVSALRPIAGAGRRRAPRLRAAYFVYGAAAALLLAVVGLSVWAVRLQQERQRLALLEQRLEERDAKLPLRPLPFVVRPEDVERARAKVLELRSALEKREKELASSQRSLAENERQLAAARAHIQDIEDELRRTTRTPEGRDRIAAASREIELSVAPWFILRGQEPPQGGVLQGGGAVNPVRTVPGGRLTVALSLADHPVYNEYRFELIDRNGEVLWTGRRPGRSLLGDAGSTVSINGLGPGRSTLRIEGLRPDRTDLLAVYLLEVTRTEGPARD